MTYPSIFNDVVGPVMRGPSSSHCAASLRIGRICHDLMDGKISEIEIDFDTHGIERIIIDEKGVYRSFCEDRYALSHLLPDAFKSLHTKKCFFTGRENWLTIEMTNQTGQKVEYEIFFNIGKRPDGNLKVFVESAYIRSDEYAAVRPQNISRKNIIKGTTLLAKKLRNEPIRHPDGRLRR